MMKYIRYPLSIFCIIIIILACFYTSLFLEVGFPQTETLRLNICRVDNARGTSQYISATLPSSLIAIDEEAFRGTSLPTVLFWNKLKSIGNRAFADNNYLTDVFVPDSVIFVGEKVFEHGTTVHGARMSYIHSWAKQNGFVFIVDNLWQSLGLSNSVLQDLLSIALCFLFPYFDISSHFKISFRQKRIKSMRPQDRPELYPINYRFP